MKLSSNEEYGLRCLLRLGYEGPGGSLTLPEISQAEGVSEAYAAKIMRTLRRGGFVKSARGKIGGYTLARPAAEIVIGDLIDEFYAEYGSLTGEKDTVDVDEIITALAKTVAEMTFGSDAAVRQRIVEDLVREISQFEAEYASAPGSDMRH